MSTNILLHLNFELNIDCSSRNIYAVLNALIVLLFDGYISIIRFISLCKFLYFIP